MGESTLNDTFEQDTKKFINEINTGLIKLENDGYSSEIINHIFRAVHSIKSEAAYLGYADIADLAHNMESAIEPLRNAGAEVEVDPVLLSFCFSTVDKIGKLADEAKLVPLYTEFELMLMKEARSRAESLYRLSFRIGDDENMKYPRAYLALSNLEKIFNVVKVEPEPENLGETADGRLTIILTTAENGSKISETIDIDQIFDISIDELSYSEELENTGVKANTVKIESKSKDERVISVEAEEIDAISEYVSEIKQRLAGITDAYRKLGGDESLGYDLAGIENISDSIEKMMSNIKTVDFNTHFAGYKRTVRDLASKLGKKAGLIFDGEQNRVQRDFADYIAEPMLQIIRNAVVHGIELPEIRKSSGKAESGTITVSLEKNKESMDISIRDDGSGINPELMSSDNSEGNLLGMISKPGFTTLAESGHFAGRGVGLDLVTDRLMKRGGHLELDNNPGKGCVFRMCFPARTDNSHFLVAESAGTAFAVAVPSGAEVYNISSQELEYENGSIIYSGLPVFSIFGRLKEKPAGNRDSFQAVRLNYMGKSGILLFEDSLFEVSHEKQHWSEGDSTDKFLKKMIIDGKEAEYMYLSPEIVNN